MPQCRLHSISVFFFILFSSRNENKSQRMKNVKNGQLFPLNHQCCLWKLCLLSKEMARLKKKCPTEGNKGRRTDERMTKKKIKQIVNEFRIEIVCNVCNMFIPICSNYNGLQSTKTMTCASTECAVHTNVVHTFCIA